MKKEKTESSKNNYDVKKLRRKLTFYFSKKNIQREQRTLRDMDVLLIDFYKSTILKINLCHYSEFYFYAKFHKKSEKDQLACFYKKINNYFKSNFNSGYLFNYYSDLYKYSKEITSRQRKIGDLKRSIHFDIFEDYYSNYTLELISKQLFEMLEVYLSDKVLDLPTIGKTFSGKIINKNEIAYFFSNKNLRVDRILGSLLFSELKLQVPEIRTGYVDIFELKDHFFLNTIDIVKKRYSPNHYDTSWCLIQLFFPGIKIKPDSLKQKQRRRVISND